MAPESAGLPGRLMAREMAEQPAVLATLVRRREQIVEAVRGMVPRPLHGIVLVARGSSDHAAIYGRYVLEAACGLPVALASPSLHTLYRAPARYEGYLAIATSQSGRTPEIVTVLERMQRHGARGIAVTTDPGSPLASAAHAVVELGAGQEEAVPATKTFTAQLAVFAFVAEALGTPPWDPAGWDAVPRAVQAVLDDHGEVRPAAEAIGDAPGLLTVGRGYLFPVALETALKLKETSSVLAQGYSSADLRHGPIAVIEHDLPVVVLAVPGAAWDDLEDLTRLLRERGARLLRITPDGDLPVPATLPEPLMPLPVAVRGQQLAHALALHRGMDPDRPEGLSKVTATN